MKQNNIIFLTLIYVSISSTLSAASPTDTTHPYNQSIADLVSRQTETIKKIVSTHQTIPNHHQSASNHHQNFHQVHQNPHPQPHKAVEEKYTLEELKIKCQHLTKLAATSANSNRTANKSDQAPAAANNVHIVRPAPYQPSAPKPTSGFYVTTKATTEPSTPSPPAPQPAQNVKFIKLEPVILQKTILSNGQTIYYWHKSLPSTVQFAPNHQFNQPPYYQPIKSIPSTNQAQQFSTTPTTTTTTTTETSGGLYFRNFFPSFYSAGNPEPASSSTTEKTTTAPLSTPKTELASNQFDETKQPDELIYQQQLKFVVPVPYEPNNEDQATRIKQPWEFDQFAYYPKPLQPETINLQVPYVPTFHVIKAVAVPGQFDNYNAEPGQAYAQVDAPSQ